MQPFVVAPPLIDLSPAANIGNYMAAAEYAITGPPAAAVVAMPVLIDLAPAALPMTMVVSA